MYADRIYILHTTQIQVHRGCNKCLHQPHLLSFWTLQENPNRQWHRIQKQTLDQSLQKVENRTKIYTHLFTTVQWQNQRFHKFLKATIAKQLENCVEWDDLVWKATAAYNFFPTESSGITPFFLMFG